MNDLRKYLSGGNVPKGKARKPKPNWRWLASFSLAIIVMVLTAHAEAQDLLNSSDPTIDPVAIQDNTTVDFVPPAVFQAAGPNIATWAVPNPHNPLQWLNPFGHEHNVAWWIILSCHAAIALGTMFGGWRIVKTMGSGITRLQPVGGFCAETAAAFTIIGATRLGIPISTTHAITGAILGVGTTRGVRSVRWIWGERIVLAWILTLPCSAFMAGIMYLAVHLVLEPFFK